MNTKWISNRFYVDLTQVEVLDQIVSLIPNGTYKTRKDTDDSGNDVMVCHMMGTSKFKYTGANLPSNLLELTGGVDDFAHDIAPILASNTGIVIVQSSVDDNTGWMSLDGFSVSPNGTITKRNLVTELIGDIKEGIGNSMWNTDMRAFW